MILQCGSYCSWGTLTIRIIQRNQTPRGPGWASLIAENYDASAICLTAFFSETRCLLQGYPATCVPIRNADQRRTRGIRKILQESCTKSPDYCNLNILI